MGIPNIPGKQMNDMPTICKEGKVKQVSDWDPEGFAIAGTAATRNRI